MARAKKQTAAVATEIDLIAGGPRPVFNKTMSIIINAEQRKDDAQTGFATAWKTAKDRGFHTEAMKLAMKLRKMSEEKRMDFLRAFDELRRELKLDDVEQMDLIDDVLDAANDEGADAVAAVPWDLDELHPVADGMSMADLSAKCSPAPGEGDDGHEHDADPADDDDLQGHADAGAHFNAGRLSGLAGEAPTPPSDLEEGSPAREMWLDGWEQGQAEKDDASGLVQDNQVDMGEDEVADGDDGRTDDGAAMFEDDADTDDDDGVGTIPEFLRRSAPGADAHAAE
jgi:uncharacterized protein (UPF0335 family)